LGMYFLLFIIGLEINPFEWKRMGGFIFRVSFWSICLSALLGGAVIYWILDYNWFVALLIGLSFSTVGEAILVPILDEFKLINTHLGQVIIGSGTLDDIIEVISLVAVTVFLGRRLHGNLNISLTVFSLFAMFALTYGLSLLRREAKRFKFSSVDTLFFFIVAIFFLFLGIGYYAEATALGAILAGVGVKTFVPAERFQVIESEVRAVCYGLFAPIFFLWVGLDMDMRYLAAAPLIVLLIVAVSSGAKFLGAFLGGGKQLGTRQVLLVGTALSVRFSTSIVVVKILFENHLIGSDLYSAIIASSIVLTMVVPIIFAQLLQRHYKEIASKQYVV
ncbi:cation:proton antiporter, partial [Candidatus Parcubacteria bacterium]